MALKLNTERTYKYPVDIKYFNESGQMQTGTFTGVFRVLKMPEFKNDKDPLINLILVGVEGLELTDQHGNVLTGDELVNAVKADSDLAAACVEAYRASSEKKHVKPKTSEAPPATPSV